MSPLKDFKKRIAKSNQKNNQLSELLPYKKKTAVKKTTIWKEADPAKLMKFSSDESEDKQIQMLQQFSVGNKSGNITNSKLKVKDFGKD